MSDRPSSPDENLSREERIRRIIADYRDALAGENPPSVEEVVAQNSDLDSELLRQLLKVQTKSDLPQNAPDVFIGDRTEAWDPESTSAEPAGAESKRRSGIGVGSRVGEYRLLSELGRGGMGVVYRAEHMPSERFLALKILSPDLPRNEKTVKRFLNEASLAAALSHPRTTFVYEAGDREGHLYISMELMPGRTLRDVVQSEGALPVNRAVDYMLDVLDGLEAAHQSGVVHRDVKPSNCFLDDQGRVKVGDFGLSKSLVATKDLTLTGTFLGTPQFAAPEQFGRGEIDHRTDVFAAAGTLYYLLAGEAPFTGDAAAVIAQIVADEPPSLHSLKPKVPRSLSRIVNRALNKNPADRYQSVAEFRNALVPYSTGGSSMADVGRRVAAFFIDIILISVVVSVAASIVVIGRYGLSIGTEALREYFWVSSTIWLLYFAISEGVFARSLGKTWLSLRVVNEFGEPPGFLRAFVRAFIIPGLSWVTIDVLQWYYTQQMNTAIQLQVRAGVELNQPAMAYLVVPQIFTLAKGLLALIVCSSMRSRNGYRGLHEFASGTRVIRHDPHESASAVQTVPRFAIVDAEMLPETIGGFRIAGRVGGSGSLEVLAGRDDQLDRPVWIYQSPASIRLPAERRRLARSTRQRWLSAGSIDDSGGWQAFEALNGAPLTEVARYAFVPWNMGIQIWSETAEELIASLADDTLPAQLSLDMLWVDQRGAVKLCDFSLDSVSADSESFTGDAEQRALQFLVAVGRVCTEDDETPAEAIDLIHELEDELNREVDQRGDTFTSTMRRLSELAGCPFRLRWDDRLGVVAISAGLETAVICMGPLLTGSFAFSSGMSIPASSAAAVVVGVGLVALVTYLTKDGPAFWLTKIAIREQKSRQAATLGRCVVRNVLAWIPAICFHAAIGPFTIASLRGLSEFGGNFAILGVFLVSVTLVNVIGVLYSIFQPRRGLQDVLAGTRLVRRIQERSLR